jgi:hypothetical protein
MEVHMLDHLFRVEEGLLGGKPRKGSRNSG